MSLVLVVVIAFSVTDCSAKVQQLNSGKTKRRTVVVVAYSS